MCLVLGRPVSRLWASPSVPPAASGRLATPNHYISMSELAAVMPVPSPSSQILLTRLTLSLSFARPLVSSLSFFPQPRPPSEWWTAGNRGAADGRAGAAVCRSFSPLCCSSLDRGGPAVCQRRLDVAAVPSIYMRLQLSRNAPAVRGGLTRHLSTAARLFS